ncbi:hypothetical protein N0V90_009494 [Kalmusia sp. IMI 367209]|nr:hypothetical protein N0V90_009494 [Kalmusia sp. IMI 367209]
MPDLYYKMVPNKIQVSIDRGGTFTDIHASVPGREDIILKLLSVDPTNCNDAPIEGIRRILEMITERPHPRGKPLEPGMIERIRTGATVDTNALLERKGAGSALCITKCFKDLLRIGAQSRPNIFDLTVAWTGLLYEAAVVVDERVTIETFTEDARRKKAINISPDHALRSGATGEPTTRR